MQKRLYEPGQMVIDMAGSKGIVLSYNEFLRLSEKMSSKQRPGCFFALGCCPTPDFITKVPVFFEDNTLSIMRPTGIRRLDQDPDDILRENLRRVLCTH